MEHQRSERWARGSIISIRAMMQRESGQEEEARAYLGQGGTRLADRLRPEELPPAGEESEERGKRERSRRSGRSGRSGGEREERRGRAEEEGGRQDQRRVRKCGGGCYLVETAALWVREAWRNSALLRRVAAGRADGRSAHGRSAHGRRLLLLLLRGLLRRRVVLGRSLHGMRL